jgi:hypothetical protein
VNSYKTIFDWVYAFLGYKIIFAWLYAFL